MWPFGCDVIGPRGKTGNRVSKTRFQVGVFSKLTPLTQIKHSPLSLTLSLTQSRHSHAFTHPLTLTLNLSLSHSLTLSTLTHSPSSLTHFSLTQSPFSVCTISHSSPSPKDLIKPQQGVQSFEFLQSTRSLKTKKKGESLCTKFTIWLPRNSGKNQRNFGFTKFFSILVSLLNF